MSACVTACVAKHSIVAPGASVAGMDGTQSCTNRAPAPGSVTVTPCRVTFPLLLTVIAYVIASPTESYGPDEVTVLTTLRAGFAISVLVIVQVTLTAGSTVTVAETDPAVPAWPLVHDQAPTLYPVREVSAIVWGTLAATDLGVPVAVAVPSIVSGKSPA